MLKINYPSLTGAYLLYEDMHQQLKTDLLMKAYASLCTLQKTLTNILGQC